MADDSKRLFSLIAAAALAAASPALAADRVVPSDDYPDIASAATAAQDGDRILVGPGVYTEAVVLTANNVQILGKKAVWDGTVGTENLFQLSIFGSGCTVSGFTFRNGEYQVDLRGSAHGTVIRKCTFRGSSSESVNVFGADDVVVERCTFIGPRDYAVYLYRADRARISRNTVRVSGDYGIHAGECNDVLVERNEVRRTSKAVYVHGSSPVVRENRVALAGNYGIYVDGASALVEDNDVQWVGGDGLSVDSAENARIEGNRVSGVLDGRGIAVSGSDASGASISGNHVSETQSIGIDVSLGTGTISDNECVQCGSDRQGGIYVSGDDNTINGNRIEESDDNALEISGDRNTVDGLVIAGSSEDGITVGGSSNVIRNATVSGCGGEGFRNDGDLTDLRDSRFTKNRTDVSRTSGATWAVGALTGVVFTTGGLDFLDEVEN